MHNCMTIDKSITHMNVHCKYVISFFKIKAHVHREVYMPL